MRCDWVVAAFICAFTAFVFCSATEYGLAPCDDAVYVANGPCIQGGLSIDGLRFALTDVSQGIWMPLPYLSYMLDYSIGYGFGGMHAQSIFWHCVNAVLFYFLLVRLFDKRLAAMVAALFWAVHPLRVESVVWIASRKDVISTCFLLLALHSWLRAGKGRLGWLVLSIMLFAVGIMAKPSIMVFPVFAIVFDFLITGRRKIPGSITGFWPFRLRLPVLRIGHRESAAQLRRRIRFRCGIVFSMPLRR